MLSGAHSNPTGWPMRLFKCQVCAQLLYFENTRCEKCGHTLGYEPLQNQLLALEPRDQVWSVARKKNKTYRFCANAAHGACNWVIDAASTDSFCLACRHNGVIPDLSQPQNLANWQKIEIAKHRLIYTLRRLNLPLQTRDENPKGLVFNFLADPPFDANARVMTGHDSGTITLAITEADDVERERRRSQMGEPYRTLLGHFRHEVGHYYWDRLVADTDWLPAFRQCFGDERADYAAALERHYRLGPPPDWADWHVSAYASCHPWEDWAETWAHYLHMVDALDTGLSFGLDADDVEVEVVPFDDTVLTRPDPEFLRLVNAWVELTALLNELSRSMGQPDFYPFVLSQAVVRKLHLVHRVVTRSA
jgi:hypothetical protein